MRLKVMYALVAVLMLSVVLVLAAPGMSEEQEAEPVAAAMGEDGVQRLDMEGGEYYFKPERVVLKVGVPVELFVRKTPGFVPHNIVMESAQAGMSFKENFGRKGITIMFTPTDTGTFEFWCDKKFLFFKSHRAKGMEGVIEVVDDLRG